MSMAVSVGDTAFAGVHSGEILFRSTPNINGPGELLEGLGGPLMDFLRAGQEPQTLRARCRM